MTPVGSAAGAKGGTFTRVSAKTAAEICKRFSLEEPAKKLLRDDLTPRQFLDLLLQQKHHLDAVRLLAYALPKQEAVWWACLCARSVAGANPPPKVAAALQAAEKWVADPSEENRRAAMPAAEAAELATPAGCAAMAAFWSGGSLGPPNVPVVPPADHLTAHGISGAVMLAAVQTEPAKAPDKYRRFFELGIEVANGTNRWKEAPPKK
jgi:hypothetical protein